MTGKTISRVELVRLLERRIMVGELKSGEKLPSERTLAELHRVGRPAIREAIRELEQQGFVETVPGKGTYVARQSVASGAQTIHRWAQRSGVSPHQIIEARMMIESKAAALAATGNVPRPLDRLRTILDRLERERNPLTAARLDIAYHLGIARLSGNPVLELLLTSLAPLTAELVVVSFAYEDLTAARTDQHRQILAAIERRDADEAGEAMRGHLSFGEQSLADIWDRPVVGPGVLTAPLDLDGLLEAEDIPGWTDQDV